MPKQKTSGTFLNAPTHPQDRECWVQNYTQTPSCSSAFVQATHGAKSTILRHFAIAEAKAWRGQCDCGWLWLRKLVKDGCGLLGQGC